MPKQPRRSSSSSSAVVWPDDLVARIQRGDEHAFAVAFHALAPALIRFALKFGISSQVAEDVVTNVFVSTWESRDSLHPDQNLKTYLFRAVRNGTIDALRSRQRELARYQQQMELGEVPGMGAPVPGADARTETEGAADLLWRIVRELPEHQRTALLLRYTQEFSLAEVANAMGVTIPAVKSLLQRAQRTLRERLGGVFDYL